MKFETNKEKGNSSLGIAIAYFSTNGYTVSIPLNDTQDYDLIVEKENKFYCTAYQGHCWYNNYYWNYSWNYNVLFNGRICSIGSNCNCWKYYYCNFYLWFWRNYTVIRRYKK